MTFNVIFYLPVTIEWSSNTKFTSSTLTYRSSLLVSAIYICIFEIHKTDFIKWGSIGAINGFKMLLSSDDYFELRGKY